LLKVKRGFPVQGSGFRGSEVQRFRGSGFPVQGFKGLLAKMEGEMVPGSEVKDLKTRALRAFLSFLRGF
jgi:hypothetical protein